MNSGMPRISCSVYNGSVRQQSLTSLDRISDVLEEPGAFVWLDIVAPKPEDFVLIQTEFAMHPLAIEDAIHSHQRPKIEAYGDSWFVIVHASSRNGNPLVLHELAIFIGHNFVVTVRALPVYSLDEIERRWHQGSNGLPRDSGALLYTILDTVVDGYLPIVEAFEEQVEALEAALLSAGTQTNAILMEIFQMRKNLSRFRGAVLPIHDILVPIIRGERFRRQRHPPLPRHQRPPCPESSSNSTVRAN
jgi:magnesium transporter